MEAGIRWATPLRQQQLLGYIFAPIMGMTFYCMLKGSKYFGICMGPDGLLYCGPCNSTSVLVVDPVSQALSFIAGAGEGGDDGGRRDGGARGQAGRRRGRRMHQWCRIVGERHVGAFGSKVNSIR